MSATFPAAGRLPAVRCYTRTRTACFEYQQFSDVLIIIVILFEGLLSWSATFSCIIEEPSYVLEDAVVAHGARRYDERRWGAVSWLARSNSTVIIVECQT